MSFKKYIDSKLLFALKDCKISANWLGNIAETRSSYLILYLLLIVILIFRRPDALVNPQPWAEDGTIFLQQAIEHSYFSLIIPYAGYLHAVPRLVTLFAIQFGLKNAPFIMNLFALLITVISSSYIFSKDFRFIIKNDASRFITAIFIICMPTDEIFFNITNIQWFLLIYLTLWTTNLILGSGSTSPVKTLFAVLGFLTCPAGVILLPALAWYIYISRSAPVLAVFSISVLCGLFGWSARTLGGQGYPSPINIIRFISIIFAVFYQTPSLVYQYGFNIAYVIAVATLIALLYYAKDEWAVDAWIGYLFVSYVLVIAITRAGFIDSFDSLKSWTGTLRYSFLPLCLLLIICVRHACRKNYLIYIMIFIFIANIATNYNIAPFQDFDYQLHAEKFNISGQCDCVIPINPAGWSFKVPCTTLDAYSWNANGLVLDKQGEYDEALKAFNKAIELNPKYAEAWNNKGNALKSIGRTTETDAAFTRAKELGYKG